VAKVLVDTNIIISALLFPGSVPAQAFAREFLDEFTSKRDIPVTDVDFQAEHQSADQAWLGEIDRRIQGYYDGSIPTLSREEVNALIAADRANAR